MLCFEWWAILGPLYFGTLYLNLCHLGLGNKKFISYRRHFFSVLPEKFNYFCHLLSNKRNWIFTFSPKIVMKMTNSNAQSFWLHSVRKHDGMFFLELQSLMHKSLFDSQSLNSDPIWEQSLLSLQNNTRVYLSFTILCRTEFQSSF